MRKGLTRDEAQRAAEARKQLLQQELERKPAARRNVALPVDVAAINRRYGNEVAERRMRLLSPTGNTAAVEQHVELGRSACSKRHKKGRHVVSIATLQARADAAWKKRHYSHWAKLTAEIKLLQSAARHKLGAPRPHVKPLPESNLPVPLQPLAVEGCHGTMLANTRKAHDRWAELVTFRHKSRQQIREWGFGDRRSLRLLEKHPDLFKADPPEPTRPQTHENVRRESMDYIASNAAAAAAGQLKQRKVAAAELRKFERIGRKQRADALAAAARLEAERLAEIQSQPSAWAR